MAPAEWNRMMDLFHAAREKSGEERVALLDSACGVNTLLRKAIEDLLKEDESANGFLSKPLFGSPADTGGATRIAPGQRFGRYLIQTLIGRGGMGEVWSAHDTDLDRPVALKFLYFETLASLGAHQITREAKAASALNHPGIVTIHEVVQTEPAFAIVMELVEGEPLRELCGKPNRPSEVMAAGVQIAEALAAAHAGGIVHGDIKPENILLRRDRYVKVLDFGLARKISVDAISFGSSTMLGTLRYLSPEQARGKTLTPASDVFSLGLVLYELTAGHHPFAAASPLDTAQAILTKEPASLCSISSSVPARLDGLIRAMLAKDAAARPSAQQVARKLDELQRSRDISALPVWMLSIAAVVFVVFFAARYWKQVWDTRPAVSFRQITTLVPQNRATAASISPDGKLAAYANVDGIFIRTIQNGDTRELPAPPEYIADRLDWFADSKKLVASGFSSLTYVPSIWIVPVDGSSPILLRTHARSGTPSPDGSHIAYISQDLSEIWVMRVGGEEPRRIVAGSTEDRFSIIFWSRDGRWLGFRRQHIAPQSHFKRYESIMLTSGKITTGKDLEMSSAAALPDGRLMYLRWDNPSYSSSNQLWEVKTDPVTGALRGKAQRIATLSGETTSLLDLSVTADGRRAMVLKRSDQNAVFVGDFYQSPPRIGNIRRLTLDERTSYPHAWTADGRAVIFESDRRGNFDIFKQYIDQPTPQAIIATPLTEMLPQLSPDGRFVLYAEGAPENEERWYYKPRTYKLMRVPVGGGTPVEVPIGGPLDEFRCALDRGGRCVLRTTVPGEYYVYYALDPILGKGRELARTKWLLGVLGNWDISPDGTHVAIPNHDFRSARIRVLALSPGRNERTEREVVLKGLTNLRGLTWAANGRGWFVSVDTTVGNRLLYVYLDGNFRPLGDISGWAVPSPDGRHVAFLDRIVATNAWMIERH